MANPEKQAGDPEDREIQSTADAQPASDAAATDPEGDREVPTDAASEPEPSAPEAQPSVGAEQEAAAAPGADDAETASAEAVASGGVAAAQERPTGAPRPLRAPRPYSLLRNRGLRYVNKMLNVAWLAGYTHKGDDEHSILLQQTNNIEQALRVELGDRHARLARSESRPVLIMAHVRGMRNEDGPQAVLKCVDVDRPTLSDLPASEVWASGFGHGKDSAKILSRMRRDGFTPFDADGHVIETYRPFLVSADPATGAFEVNERAKSLFLLQDVMQASNSVIDSRLGRGQNYVLLAGVVDSRAWIVATEHRREYGLIMLRQQANPDVDIPVRIVGAKAKLDFTRAVEGRPIVVEGSIRRKAIPKDDDVTQVASRHSYIETTRIRAAQPDRDVLMPAPAWWGEIRDRLVARREMRQAAHRAREAAPAAEALSAEEIGGIA